MYYLRVLFDCKRTKRKICDHDNFKLYTSLIELDVTKFLLKSNLHSSSKLLDFMRYTLQTQCTLIC